MGQPQRGRGEKPELSAEVAEAEPGTAICGSDAWRNCSTTVIVQLISLRPQIRLHCLICGICTLRLPCYTTRGLGWVIDKDPASSRSIMWCSAHRPGCTPGHTHTTSSKVVIRYAAILRGDKLNQMCSPAPGRRCRTEHDLTGQQNALCRCCLSAPKTVQLVGGVRYRHNRDNSTTYFFCSEGADRQAEAQLLESAVAQPSAIKAGVNQAAIPAEVAEQPDPDVVGSIQVQIQQISISIEAAVWCQEEFDMLAERIRQHRAAHFSGRGAIQGEIVDSVPTTEVSTRCLWPALHGWCLC